jgi:indolepyruvate ferredoxin oxidoreductase
VRAAEARVAPGESGLTRTVAEQAFRLMACKDEYEVARRDPHTGLPRKQEYGPWLLPVLRGLARLRRLRGTALDPFGYTEERRTERRLIGEYFALVEELIAALAPGNHALAVELAGWSRTVRGFGHVKAKALAAAEARRDELLVRWRGRVCARADAAAAPQ